MLQFPRGLRYKHLQKGGHIWCSNVAHKFKDYSHLGGSSLSYIYSRFIPPYIMSHAWCRGRVRKMHEAVAWFSSSGVKDSKQHHPGDGETLLVCVSCAVTAEEGTTMNQRGVLLLPFQRELAEWSGKGEQFIHSQHQTFNFQINPMPWHCRMENQPHLSKHIGTNLRTSCGFSFLHFVFVGVHTHTQLRRPVRSESREPMS